MNSINVTFDMQNLTEMLHGMQQLCDGIHESVFDMRIEYVLQRYSELTPSENAYDWLAQNYNMLAGAFRLMAAASDIVSTAIINGEAEIVAQKTEGA